MASPPSPPFHRMEWLRQDLFILLGLAKPTIYASNTERTSSLVLNFKTRNFRARPPGAGLLSLQYLSLRLGIPPGAGLFFIIPTPQTPQRGAQIWFSEALRGKSSVPSPIRTCHYSSYFPQEKVIKTFRFLYHPGGEGEQAEPSPREGYTLSLYSNYQNSQKLSPFRERD